MARIPVLHFGASGAVAAVFSGSARKLKVTSFNVVGGLDAPSGEEDIEQAAPELKALASSAGVSRGEPLVAISTRDAMIRRFAVPFSKPDQVRKTIKFQAESHYHSVPIDDLLVEYQPVGVTGSSTVVWTAAVRKNRVFDTIAFCRAAGINPSAIDIDLACLFNFLSFYLKNAETAPEPAAEETGEEQARPRAALLVDADDRSCRLVLGRGDVMLDGRMFLMNEPSPGRAAREIGKFLLAGGIEASDVDVYLTGTLANAEFASGLGDELGTEVRMPRPDEIVETDLEGEDARAFRALGAAAVGLALKRTGFDAVGLDFRKEEFRYERKFDRLKKGLACTMCLLFVAFFLMAYHYQLNGSRHLPRYRQILEECLQQKWFRTVAPGEEVKKDEGYYEALRGALRKRMGMGVRGFPQTLSGLEMLRDVSTQLLRANQPFEWQSAHFSQGNCNIKLLVDSASAADIIYRTMSSHSEYFKPNPPSSNRSRDKIVMTMQLELKRK